MNNHTDPIFEKANELLINGVDKITRAVATTFGPQGSFVVIGNRFHAAATKDGVTVARNVILEDENENLGASLVKQAAKQTVDEAGDGTSQSMIMARAFIEELPVTDYEAANILKDKWEEYIEKNKSVLPHTVEAVKSISMISSNGDEKLSVLVSNAFDRVDFDGTVLIVDAPNESCSVEVTEGFKMKSGFAVHHFANNEKRSAADYASPDFIVTSDKIDHWFEVEPILAKHFYDRSDNLKSDANPLVFIAKDFSEEIINGLVNARVNVGVNVLAIKLPLGRHMDISYDIALYTDATLFGKDHGRLLTHFTNEDYGAANQIISTAKQTTIVEGIGDVRDHIENLKSELPSLIGMEEDIVEQRLARLQAKMSTIFVGADTPAEQSELKDRLEDTVKAVKAALTSGYIIGGGITHLNFYLENIELPGVKAFQVPYAILCQNASLEPMIFKGGEGYDFRKREIVDMKKAGIIEPAQVAISAVKNALSVAKVINKSQCIVKL